MSVRALPICSGFVSVTGHLDLVTFCGYCILYTILNVLKLKGKLGYFIASVILVDIYHGKNNVLTKVKFILKSSYTV